jgi:hypothetical protein
MAAKSGLEKWYWIAGVVGTIIAGFALSEHSDKVSGILHFGRNQRQIVRNQGTIIADPKAAAANEPVDIVGKWDRAQGEAMAVAELERKAWDPEDFLDGDPPYAHKFVSEHSVLFKNRHLIVLTFQTAPKDYVCRSCIPFLSFFEFEERQGGWKRISSDLGVVRVGRDGKFLQENISVRVIGENTYGVFLTDWDTSDQGVWSRDVSVLARIGGSFRKIMGLETGYSVPESGGWSSTITTSPTSTGLYDLVVDRVQNDPHHTFKWNDGRDGDRKGVADDDGSIRPRDVFKFDGNSYVRRDDFR